MDIVTLLIIVGSAIGFLIFVGLVLSRLYRRTTREVALVRTGAGGRRLRLGAAGETVEDDEGEGTGAKRETTKSMEKD